MPQFKNIYSEKDFLDTLNGELRTLGGIAKIVGCARMTCISHMKSLVEAGKVERLSVDDGQLFVYRKV